MDLYVEYLKSKGADPEEVRQAAGIARFWSRLKEAGLVTKAIPKCRFMGKTVVSNYRAKGCNL